MVQHISVRVLWHNNWNGSVCLQEWECIRVFRNDKAGNT